MNQFYTDNSLLIDVYTNQLFSNYTNSQTVENWGNFKALNDPVYYSCGGYLNKPYLQLGQNSSLTWDDSSHRMHYNFNFGTTIGLLVNIPESSDFWIQHCSQTEFCVQLQFQSSLHRVQVSFGYSYNSQSEWMTYLGLWYNSLTWTSIIFQKLSNSYFYLSIDGLIHTCDFFNHPYEKYIYLYGADNYTHQENNILSPAYLEGDVSISKFVLYNSPLSRDKFIEFEESLKSNSSSKSQDFSYIQRNCVYPAYLESVQDLLYVSECLYSANYVPFISGYYACLNFDLSFCITQQYPNLYNSFCVNSPYSPNPYYYSPRDIVTYTNIPNVALRIQPDGNMVIVNLDNNQIFWSTNTQGSSPLYGVLTDDGCFLLYEANELQVVWNSGNCNHNFDRFCINEPSQNSKSETSILLNSITRDLNSQGVFESDALNYVYGQITGISLDKFGNIVFSDISNNCISMIIKSGGSVKQIVGGVSGASHSFVNGMAASNFKAYPSEIAIDSNGNYVFIDSSEKLILLDMNSLTLYCIFDVTSRGSFIFDLMIDSDDNVYVTGAYVNLYQSGNDEIETFSYGFIEVINLKSLDRKNITSTMNFTIYETNVPTHKPTFTLSSEPTVSFLPTFEPTILPSSEPTLLPTFEPTSQPSSEPSLETTSIPIVFSVRKLSSEINTSRLLEYENSMSNSMSYYYHEYGPVPTNFPTYPSIGLNISFEYSPSISLSADDVFITVDLWYFSETSANMGTSVLSLGDFISDTTIDKRPIYVSHDGYNGLGSFIVSVASNSQYLTYLPTNIYIYNNITSTFAIVLRFDKFELRDDPIFAFNFSTGNSIVFSRYHASNKVVFNITDRFGRVACSAVSTDVLSVNTWHVLTISLSSTAIQIYELFEGNLINIVNEKCGLNIADESISLSGSLFTDKTLFSSISLKTFLMFNVAMSIEEITLLNKFLDKPTSYISFSNSDVVSLGSSDALLSYLINSSNFQCKMLCTTESKCVLYEIDTNTKECWLFSSVNYKNIFNANYMYSGRIIYLKYPTSDDMIQRQLFLEFTDTNSVEGTPMFYDTSVRNIDECLARCATITNCKQVVYHHPRCWTKIFPMTQDSLYSEFGYSVHYVVGSFGSLGFTNYNEKMVSDNILAIHSSLVKPYGVAKNSRGDIIFTDQNRIRIIYNDSGIVTTIAGSGNFGYSGDYSYAKYAVLNNPTSIKIDEDDNIYVIDNGNNVVRRINMISGMISTFAGKVIPIYNKFSARIQNPGALAYQNGFFYIADGRTIKMAKEVLNSQYDVNHFYFSMHGEYWRDSRNWLSSKPLDQWYGLKLVDNNVVSISLRNNYLQGSLIYYFFSSIKYLDLAYNHITQLSENVFSDSLESLDISWNEVYAYHQYMTCSILWLSKLINIKELLIANIRTEDIQSNLWLPSTIEVLDATNVNYFYSLNIPQLRVLKLKNSNITFFPNEILKLQKLTILDLTDNSISGTFPIELASLSNLTHLYLGGNNFQGKISNDFCNLSHLVYFDISADQSNICYPSCLGKYVSDSIGSIRCQDETDIAICSIAKQLQVKSILLQKYASTGGSVTYSSVGFPFSYELYANINIKIAIPLSSGLSISFDPRTNIANENGDQVCINEKCFGIALNGSSQGAYPGVNGVPPLIINLDNFYIRFLSSGISSNKTGFSLTATSTREVNGWVCESPKTNFQMNNLSHFLSEHDLILNESYASNVCSNWNGIFCDGLGYIKKLDLSYSGLIGTLPSSITLLQTLQILNLKYNNFIGRIPSLISNLKSLNTLILANNEFSSSLPIELGYLNNLTYLYLENNKFSGDIPTSLADLENLMTLQIGNTKVSGILDSQFNVLLNRNTSINISETSISCFSPILELAKVRGLLITDVEQCFPTSQPTGIPSGNPTTRPSSHPISITFPPNSVLNSSFMNTSYFIIVIVIASVIAFGIVGYMLWKNFSKSQKRKYERTMRLRNLPVHMSISMKKHDKDEDLHKFIIENLATLHEKDYDGNTAFQLAMEHETSIETQQLLLEYSLPINPINKEEISSDIHNFHWTEAIQNDENVDIIVNILDKYPNLINCLVSTVDKDGRVALSIASPLCQYQMKIRTLFLRKYEIFDVKHPIHISPTAMVHLVKEHVINGKVLNRALKFMSIKEQYLCEIETRKNESFNTEYVIELKCAYDSMSDDIFKAELDKFGFNTYAYCIVMDAGEKDLETIILREDIVAKDYDAIRLLTKQLAIAIQSLHDFGYIHGDIKPMNIMRIEGQIKLIDLDASRKIGSDYSNFKYSSAYLSPELISLTPQCKEILITDTTNNWSEQSLTFGLLLCHWSQDSWSFGVVLYKLLTGVSLFLSNTTDSIHPSSILDLYHFTDNFKDNMLSSISNKFARNLVYKLLSKDPNLRPNMHAVLQHPFVTGLQPMRMPDEPAEYDVFISYRVRCDFKYAEELYLFLTKIGVRVWWDKTCLEPGENWQIGFCKGLVKSLIYIPILSREAINSLAFQTNNYNELEADSPIDNLLLEQYLSLELVARGLFKKVYPVLLGDEIKESFHNDFFFDECFPKIKDSVVVPNTVISALKSNLYHLSLGSPLLDIMNVKQVLDELLMCQGKVVKGNRLTCLDRIVKDIEVMLQKL